MGMLLLLLSCSSEPEVLHTVDYIADGKSTVFEQLRTHQDVEYDSSAMGIFVKSIGGVSQTRTAYWLYVVNGESVPTAAGEFVPEEGDTVEWRLVSGY